MGGGEVEVAPRAALGLIAELFEDVGLQGAGGGVGGVGEHRVAEQLGRPPVVLGTRGALVGLPGQLHDLGGAAHRLDVAGPGLLGGQGVQMGGVAVVPAEIALVDSLDVVVGGAVVAAVEPLSRQALR